MNRFLPVLLSLSLLAPAACDRRPGAPSSASLDVLLQRMHARLDLMHTVARVKWNAQSPILDPERERALLEDVVERGKAYRLDAEVTRVFFAAQMEAAKLVQEEDFRRWRGVGQPPFADVPDLPALRRRIDVLNGEVLAALAAAQPALDGKEGQRELDRLAADRFADIAEPVREAALRPLRKRAAP